MPCGTLCKQLASPFAYGAFTLFSGPFQNLRLKSTSQTLRAAPLSLATTRGMFSFPQATKMFQFACLPRSGLCVQPAVRGHAPTRVSPFGHLQFKRMHTPGWSFSQCTASFFGA